MPRKKRIVSQTAQEAPIEKPIKSISPRNKEQAKLIQCIHNNDLIVIKGKAGSGKSAICAGMAAEYLQRGIVDKIVITRVCVGSEDIGFLPGNAIEKIEPYIQAIMIELGQFLNVKREMAQGKIEIVPIAYMRGRTFLNAFVILEEAQNCTTGQIKMFLTRMGQNSKFLINGDIEQSDLHHRDSGDFSDFIERIKTISGPENRIAVFELMQSVRHPLIEKILNVFNSGV